MATCSKCRIVEVDDRYGFNYVELCPRHASVDALEKDKERLDWLQKKYGEMPWRLVDMVPGTMDIRIAIDRARIFHDDAALAAAKGGKA